MSYQATRRAFLQASVASVTTLALPKLCWGRDEQSAEPITLGMIADLHQDIMHDGETRMRAFVTDMVEKRPAAVVQLGDFAYPNAKNKSVIDMFNESHEHTLHVIGNHDTDAGHTKQQCLDIWGMAGRFYSTKVNGLNLIVLDGNDKGSPTHGGGYVSFIGPEQVDWLKKQLTQLDGPAIVLSHQPLAGPGSIDNAAEIQDVLGSAADRILLAINGHTHIDDLVQVKGVSYLHINSASYYWVGGDHKHDSYTPEIHAEYPYISHTCPYRDPLFTLLTIDPVQQTIQVEGHASTWVGKSPADLGVKEREGLQHGEEIAPEIRARELTHNKPS